jgi:hypothetical protein
MEAYPPGLPRGEVLYPVSASTHPDVELCTQIDQDRTVATGASYSGYAIKCVFCHSCHLESLILTLSSWIQGKSELGFEFKVLVCHDGMRSLLHEGKARTDAVRSTP